MKNHALVRLFAMYAALCAFPAMADEPIPEQPNPAPITEFAQPVKEAPAAPVATMNIKVAGIADGAPIAPKFAYCMPDGKGKTKDGQNISPAVSWSGAPAGTKSYTLIMMDTDVPASFESANQPGKEIGVRFARQDFYHWILADIAPKTQGLLEGKASSGITPGGKPVGQTGYGINGRNDYAKVYTGTFGGYDGPCPPWNDLRLHHYHFIIYALDIPSLRLPNPITGLQAEAAMQGHILAKGETVGIYSNNVRWLPELKAQAQAQSELDKAQSNEKKMQDTESIRRMKLNMERAARLQKSSSQPPARPVTPDELIDKH